MKAILLIASLFYFTIDFNSNSPILDHTAPNVAMNSHHSSTLDASMSDSIADYRFSRALILEGDISKATLICTNGCGIGNFLIPCSGDSSQGIPPTFGAIIRDWQERYRALDTLSGTEIKGVAFRFANSWGTNNINNSQVEAENSNAPYVVITDQGLYAYNVPFDADPYLWAVTELDSVSIPGIVKVAKRIYVDATSPIVVLVETSPDQYEIQVYDYPELNLSLSVPLTFEPDVFEQVSDTLFLAGYDANNQYTLQSRSLNADQLYESYTLNDASSNAQEMIRSGDSLFILSSPGDSVSLLTTLDLNDGTFSQHLVYLQSGAGATYNYFRNQKHFTFQPIIDSSSAALHRQILILDPLNYDIDTLMIEQEFDYFKHPKPSSAGFGYFDLEWIGAKRNQNAMDTLYLMQGSWDTLKIGTPSVPNFVNATFGCWVSVDDKASENIAFNYYPNPTSSKINIHLSGLNSGKTYHLDVLDQIGNILHSTSLTAYQNLELPLEHLAKGIYWLRLNTGERIISKKLIIQ